jgi:hypothetical protein
VPFVTCMTLAVTPPIAFKEKAPIIDSLADTDN